MPLALTRRGWAFVLAAFGLWASWFAIGLRDVWYLAALLAAMVVLALLWLIALPLFARLRVRVTAANATPVVGERVSCTAVVSHRLPMSLPLRAEWKATNERRLVSLSVSPGQGAVSHAAWVEGRRGLRRVGLARLIVLDPLGLAERRLRLRAETELLVLPAGLARLARELDELVLPMNRADSASGRSRPHDSGSPSGAVRGYRSGDALRQIHWKQSARQGELLVNLPDSSEDPGRSLLLAASAQAYSSEEEFETAVSAAATLVAHWFRRGRTVRVQLGEDQPVLCGTEGEALRHLARAELSAETQSFSAIDPRFDAVDAVVSGAVPESLMQALRRQPGGGVLLSAVGPLDAALPPRWRRIGISAAEQGLDSTIGVEQHD